MKPENVTFPGFDKPSIDFGPVRDLRRATLFYYDIDLSTARAMSDNTALVLPLAGNSFYVDQSPTTGAATIHFQDTNLNSSAAPVYVLPGFIAKVPFTQIMVENAAQAGKRLRIFYGVDVDFVGGMNATISISSVVPVLGEFLNTQKTVTNASNILSAADADRKYFLVQNNHATGNIFVQFGAAAAVASGVKIPPGSSYELNANMTSGAIYAVGDIASNAAVITVEG